MTHNNDYLSEPKIVVWKKQLIDNGCSLGNLEPLYTYFRPNGELLFALLKADITAPDGTKIPPVIFIRGNACIIVPLLINKDTGERKFLMVVQRRIATGAQTLEFPAGMLDLSIDAPVYVALKELREETGLSLTSDALFTLCDKPLCSSPGASDEAIYYFGCCIRMDDDVFRSFEGRMMGEQSENEHIRVTLKTKAEALEKLCSLQARLGIYLFEDYCQNHSLA